MKKSLDNKLIGQRIKFEREKLGLTREQFSEIIGISITHFTHIERGEKTMSLATFFNIAEKLNVPSDYLLFDKNIYNINKEDIYALIDCVPDKELKVIQDIIISILPYLRK
jgi:transcriptional regulator with XRE-family HTH domain